MPQLDIVADSPEATDIDQRNTVVPTEERSPGEMTTGLDITEYRLLDIDELRGKVAELEAGLTPLALKSQESLLAFRQAREAARDHESIIELRIKLQEMREKIEDAIDALPEVAEVRAEADKLRKELLDQMNLRTLLNNLIAQKERDLSDQTDKDAE